MFKTLLRLALLALLLCSVICGSGITSSAADPPAKNSSPDTPMEKTAPKASLFLIGGSADSTLGDFVKLAGGAEANIAIITFASSVPVETGDELQNEFASLGVKHITVILPGAKGGLPKDVNAIFMSGGDQNRLKRLLDEPLVSQLKSFDGLIGGTSAGAMIASPKMIAGGMNDGLIQGESLRIGEGLMLLPGIVVDTHVGPRTRDVRLASALALIAEASLAVGLDEDTAVYIKDNKATVYGKGHVRLVSRGPNFVSSLSDAKKETRANVKNVNYSILASGDEFDLPSTDPQPVKAAVPSN